MTLLALRAHTRLTGLGLADIFVNKIHPEQERRPKRPLASQVDPMIHDTARSHETIAFLAA